MSLLALLATGAGSSIIPLPPDPSGSDGEPYTIPTSAPWNVPVTLVTPTYEGSGVSTHPDVIDFGVGGWNGHRYWMAFTPFPDAEHEDPSILVSDQAAAGWQVPQGLTNPVYPWPGTIWNSDTDLLHDPATDELVLVYRDETRSPVVARSSDGVTWPASAVSMNISDNAGEMVSPAVVRMGATDWRMWTVDLDPGGNRVYLRTTTSPSLTSGWTTSVACDLGDLPVAPWHLDVVHVDNQFWMLLHSAADNNLYAGTSVNGIEWAFHATPLMKRGDATPHAQRPEGWQEQPYYFEWDKYQLYRSTFTPHENTTHFRVWYVGGGVLTPGATGTGHRIGYTRIPRSAWPAPPS